jgi:hypothetical protein
LAQTGGRTRLQDGNQCVWNPKAPSLKFSSLQMFIMLPEGSLRILHKRLLIVVFVEVGRRSGQPI